MFNPYNKCEVSTIARNRYFILFKYHDMTSDYYSSKSCVKLLLQRAFTSVNKIKCSVMQQRHFSSDLPVVPRLHAASVLKLDLK